MKSESLLDKDGILVCLDIAKDYCEVYGERVPEQYLEGHQQKYYSFCDLLKSHVLLPNGFSQDTQYIEFSFSANSVPESFFDFIIGGKIIAHLERDRVFINGIQLDMTDSVGVAISVYSVLREVVGVFEKRKKYEVTEILVN